MPPAFDHPISVIVDYLKQSLPGQSVARVGATTIIEVWRGDRHLRLTLDETKLSDLAQVLGNAGLPTGYKNHIIRDMTLGTLVAFGKHEMAPDFEVAQCLVDERLDWHPRVSLQALFDAETAKKLYEGLKTLDAHAAGLVRSDVPVSGIEKEREVMGTIIGHYDKAGHLNAWEVSGESLSYLKAAALCWILELEEKKAATTSPRVKAALSVKLFELVEKFWLAEPWARTRLPPIIHDYLPQRATVAKAASADLGPSLNIGPALKQLDPHLEARWRGAWQTLRSDNPDKVSQAANSMVEVLDKVIDRFCGGRQFKDVLAERFPMQEKRILKQLEMIRATKSGLHAVKHETNPQSVHDAEDLMHAAEGIIRTLLR